MEKSLDTAVYSKYLRSADMLAIQPKTANAIIIFFELAMIGFCTSGKLYLNLKVLTMRKIKIVLLEVVNLFCLCLFCNEQEWTGSPRFLTVSRSLLLLCCSKLCLCLCELLLLFLQLNVLLISLAIELVRKLVHSL